MCGGVQIHVRDRRVFEPYLTGIMVIATIRSLYPESFLWRQPPYEYEMRKMPIEILCGGTRIPDSIWCGMPLAQIKHKVEKVEPTSPVIPVHILFRKVFIFSK